MSAWSKNRRYAVDRTLLEVPAGTIDPGESPDRTAEARAAGRDRLPGGPHRPHPRVVRQPRGHERANVPLSLRGPPARSTRTRTGRGTRDGHRPLGRRRWPWPSTAGSRMPRPCWPCSSANGCGNDERSGFAVSTIAGKAATNSHHYSSWNPWLDLLAALNDRHHRSLASRDRRSRRSRISRPVQAARRGSNSPTRTDTTMRHTKGQPVTVSRFGQSAGALARSPKTRLKISDAHDLGCSLATITGLRGHPGPPSRRTYAGTQYTTFRRKVVARDRRPSAAPWRLGCDRCRVDRPPRCNRRRACVGWAPPPTGDLTSRGTARGSGPGPSRLL